jgi:DNA gyrase/topoisomerase IV subunit A
MDNRALSENLQAVLKRLQGLERLIHDQDNRIDSLQKELEEVRQKIGQDNAEQLKRNREESFYRPPQSLHFPSIFQPVNPYPPQYSDNDKRPPKKEKKGFENLFTMDNLQMVLTVLNSLNEKNDEPESEIDSYQE